VTFGDTNAAGNVYFANYFRWQGECREALLAQAYPEFAQDLEKGFGMVTEFAHMDFSREAVLFDRLVVEMSVTSLSRTRIEFHFDFLRESDGERLCSGKQAVVWINAKQRPSLMPDALYEQIERFFEVRGS
jgi:enediyne biosynthesis thioesterase